MKFIPFLQGLFKRGGKFFAKNSPTILTGIGAGGVITSVIFAVKATPKAEKLIEQRKEELQTERLEPVEVIKTCWPVYIPTAGLTLASIGCMVGANTIHLKRNAALASLYATTEHTLREYQQQVVETIGEEAEKDIRGKLKEKMQKEEKENLPAVRPVGMARCLFKIGKSDYFCSTIMDVMRAENRLNRRLYVDQEMNVSYNEILDELDLPPDDEDGEDLGLTIDDGVLFELIPKVNGDGEEYIYISFADGHQPHRNYRNFY